MSGELTGHNALQSVHLTPVLIDIPKDDYSIRQPDMFYISIQICSHST